METTPAPRRRRPGGREATRRTRLGWTHESPARAVPNAGASLHRPAFHLSAPRGCCLAVGPHHLRRPGLAEQAEQRRLRVLVTGGASGIGAALARRFARDGARVAVLDLDHDALARFRKEAPEVGLAVRTFRLPVLDSERPQPLVVDAGSPSGVDVRVGAVPSRDRRSGVTSATFALRCAACPD
ncbi:SDR family NAD(P)-dependent oxidoreductase [Streptomyces cyaneofuscatus]|uniref:SDR family NAD(P)-dependent oxidoreductase n=1 Tax=Streptomyces cyaneofuscatus TaxID=66883 RepID=UPI00379F9AA2